jgi:hypothetical protein
MTLPLDCSKKAIAKYLISAGADVTVVEKTGCTAFDMASLLGEDSSPYSLFFGFTVRHSKPLLLY